MKFIEDVKDLADKVVVLRSDLNAESVEASLKLDKSLLTCKFLLEKGAKIVLLSHRGRPDLSKVDLKNIPAEFSLRFVLDFLSRNLNTEIVFLPNFDFSSHKKLINSSQSKVFVLENIRMHIGENGEDEGFGKQIASLGDLYVNDAFGSWHKGASVTVLPKIMPSFAGILLRQEIDNLSNIMGEVEKPLVVILAGGKAEDKFLVLENFSSKADKFLIAGVFANTILKATGEDIGLSIIDEGLLKRVPKYFNNDKIQLPIDFIRDEEGRIMDLGKKSQKLFAEIIKSAKSVIWNGPMGVFEVDEFREGSEVIARAIAENDGFSVVGGGETTNLIMQMGLTSSFTWLSTGGGAMLSFLAGKKLPALEALGYYYD